MKLLITPWDLDASCGRDAGGDPLTNDVKWQAFGEQLGGINNLIWNLSHYYPHDFANQLCHRWQYLKTHQLSLETVRQRMTVYADQFTRSGAWDREYEFAKSVRASGKQPKQAATPYEEIDYIIEFLTRNYAVLDSKLEKWGADPIKSGESITFNGGTILSSSLTNDGVDCKGSINMTGGTLYAYGPDGAEGCFDNNGKTFAISGGTIIAAAYKGDGPQASKSSQASFRYYKQKGIKQHVRILDAQGEAVLSFETPAHSTMTLVVTSPVLQKGATYTIMTCDTEDGEYSKVADIKAE